MSVETINNRAGIIKRLMYYISIGRHMYIQAPNHLDKTLLLSEVTDELKEKGQLSYAACCLRLSSDIESSIRMMCECVDEVILDALSSNIKGENTDDFISESGDILENVFKTLTPTIGSKSGKLTLTSSHVHDISTFEDTLQGLDKIASQLNQIAVLYIDEFQEISKLSEFMEIESVIRETVEDTSSICFIFSGTDTFLLTQAFGDQKRPMYKHIQPFIIE